MAIDGITGDYGSGFFGYAVNSGTYIVNHPDFGPVAFSGNLKQKGKWWNTEITSAGKSRVFLAPEKLWIQTTAGKIKSLRYNTKTKVVYVDFDPADPFTSEAKFTVDTPHKFRIDIPKDENGQYKVDLNAKKSVRVKISL